MAAKYEAGQLWVKDGSYVAVLRQYADGRVQITTDTGTAEAYTQTQAAYFLHGYTLSNPRGLREAAEALYGVAESWYALQCHSVVTVPDKAYAVVARTAKVLDDVQKDEALRTALEGSGDAQA
jgi:hypothetical protein